ncbi:hypothetical protein [Pantoea sp. 1.19]|nr:hypothetical protein [Pantoea sp. 1.19]
MLAAGVMALTAAARLAACRAEFEVWRQQHPYENPIPAAVMPSPLAP